MQVGLLLHVAAGTVAIAGGVGAASLRKGSRLHRRVGQVFVASMFAMALLGIYLALAVPPTTKIAAPPKASVSIALLTCYLVSTAWAAARRRAGAVGAPEYAALAAALGMAAVLLFFGFGAARAAAGPRAFAPYFVFAVFAVGCALADLRLILRGGVGGSARITRHLWRMCCAWFFANAFFFLGQQKVMPYWLRGSPALLVVALVPLAIMCFWLVRMRAAGPVKEGQAPCRV
jgi:uncharacterized membrane protein